MFIKTKCGEENSKDTRQMVGDVHHVCGRGRVNIMYVDICTISYNRIRVRYVYVCICMRIS